MANWLQKILLPAQNQTNSKNLPIVRKDNYLPQKSYVPPSRLPNATLIYGVAASVMLVMAIYLIVRGFWLTGLLVALSAVALLGFALHFMRR